MEYNNLKRKDKILGILQETINKIDVNTNYSHNYENFLRMYAAIKKLRTVEPNLKFKISKIPKVHKNYFSKNELEK
jgi:hypothetical protein